jgi:pyruvate kinase
LKSVISDTDYSDIEFAVKHNFDFISLSYVRSAEDVRALREILVKAHSGMKIIAKIESREALENFDSILAEADAVLISRGDLGMLL